MIIAIMKSEAITVVEEDDDNKNINKNNKQYNDVYGATFYSLVCLHTVLMFNGYIFSINKMSPL